MIYKTAPTAWIISSLIFNHLISAFRILVFPSPNNAHIPSHPFPTSTHILAPQKPLPTNPLTPSLPSTPNITIYIIPSFLPTPFSRKSHFRPQCRTRKMRRMYTYSKRYKEVALRERELYCTKSLGIPGFCPFTFHFFSSHHPLPLLVRKTSTKKRDEKNVTKNGRYPCLET